MVNAKNKLKLRGKYRDLEMHVLRELRNKVENSNVKSDYIDSKTLKINLYNYTELVILNDHLTFITNQGQHFSVFSVALDDLIDLI